MRANKFCSWTVLEDKKGIETYEVDIIAPLNHKVYWDEREDSFRLSSRMVINNSIKPMFSKEV